MKNIFFASGGSGGHLAPAIALSQRAENTGKYRVWVGTTRKAVDLRMIEKYPTIDFVNFPSAPLVGGLLRKILAVGTNLWGALQVIRFFVIKRIGWVGATGGFGCVPVVIAAGLTGIPIVLHESNSVPGKVTRWFKPVFQKIYVTRLISGTYRAWKNTVVTGFPLRGDFQCCGKGEGKSKLGINLEKPLITVFGGSQGAKALTIKAVEMADEWTGMGYQVICVTGPDNHQPESKLPDEFIVQEFIEDMGLLLSATDVLVARSGAGSIAEIAEAGCTGILVPLPGSADNHQLYNAKAFVDAGCALYLDQGRLDEVGEWVEQLIEDGPLRAKMVTNLRTWAEQNSGNRLMDDLFSNREGIAI